MYKRILLGLIAALFVALPAMAQLPPGGIPSGTWARVPGSGLPAKFYYATDFGVSGTLLRSTGTRWKPVNGCTVLATLDAVSANVPNTEAVVFQYLMPANLLQLKDRLHVLFTMTKSGATNTGTARIRMGTLGTTSDAPISTSGVTMSAANLIGGFFWDFRMETATTVLQLAANSATTAGYTSVGNGAFGVAGTLTSSLVTNPIYVDLTIVSSGATDTVAVQDAQLQLCATAN